MADKKQERAGEREAMIETIADLEGQRDELLAAAKAALETFQELRDNGVLDFEDDMNPYAQLETAIHTAEQGE